MLLKCFAGCDYQDILAAIDLEPRDLFDRAPGGGGAYIPPVNTATLQHSARIAVGCTLEEYAAAKRLPVAFLRACGLSDIHYLGRKAVRIPYPAVDGTAGPIRFRLALEKGVGGDNRFAWKRGSKPTLYGLDRLPAIREQRAVLLVEGESDCHTCWYANVEALGLPGAGNWNEERDAPHLDGIEAIYIVVEPDSGGEAVRKWLATSRIRDRARLVDLGEHKDPSGLYLADPDAFRDRLAAALAAAVPWRDQAHAEAEARAAEAWAACRELATAPDILARFLDAQRARGVVGEGRAMALVYLAVTSRLLDRPLSVAVKGPSSGGKSFTTERTIDFFPPEAVYALSAMSEHALAYSEEPLMHRMLVLYEAAGMTGDFASYLMRTLLSEGRIRYETVVKTNDGPKARLIEREGPTGLVVTTTAVHLHPENETRLLSIPVTDTPEQTRQIFRALAEEAAATVDLAPWHALQAWLAGACHRVTIPYAKALSDLMPPLAVRLRRDFGMILNLIRTHALLHQASRPRDEAGRIVAAPADYAAVRALVADLVAEGIEATVSDTTRDTVAAVKVARGESAQPVSVSAVAQVLKLDRGATSRRVKVALDRGYLRNEETGRGKPSKLTIGEPLPEEAQVLPTVEALAECCSVAGVREGIAIPPSPMDERSGR